jgi:hypothetical protein
VCCPPKCLSVASEVPFVNLKLCSDSLQIHFRLPEPGLNLYVRTVWCPLWERKSRICPGIVQIPCPQHPAHTSIGLASSTFTGLSAARLSSIRVTPSCLLKLTGAGTAAGTYTTGCTTAVPVVAPCAACMNLRLQAAWLKTPT